MIECYQCATVQECYQCTANICLFPPAEVFRLHRGRIV